MKISSIFKTIKIIVNIFKVGLFFKIYLFLFLAVLTPR